VLIGAAVLLGLEQGFGMKLYFALPVAIAAYLTVKLGFGLLLGADDKAS
jgi:hypothetical protein